ncbi:hypothetical protein LAZ67_2003382 [Cordylochernes scorpioides]|uniref:Reverse transcriptase domain-containing protein n=1 Tax=Cordylochernes scorpioides TaxID=51811 RepID=A0ABY6K3K5_9ARAC|nr:hypothetical protein LAZ67_2003382 [Cordylochernes scorpioides]
MGVDLESAFDSLDRSFLESLLTSLRLPPAFRAWINILYAGADATIRAGGFYTIAFPLINGLRQGCAVSAALSSIATGLLLRRLELTLGVGNVTAYADDIILLFHRDEDFVRVATVFEEYKQASGVGVNLRKSAGLCCGAWRNRGDSPLGASFTVAHQEQHPLALLDSACRRWIPFTRGLSLVGRSRAANTLVGSVIQHHLNGYLPSPPTIAKLQARLARFVWGQDHTAWLPADVMARAVAIGGLGLLDLSTHLQLACLKGVQVALRGGRNTFSWLVKSGEAWIHHPPDGTRLRPRRLRLLKLWEEASNILGLNHRALPTAQPLDLPIIGGCRIDWASLRRCAYSGHEADAALKLALHALPHLAHPASVGPLCPACGSIDRSLSHRYWCCPSLRPIFREVFNIIGRPPDLQAWIFGGSGLEDDALSILASAKLRIYRYFVQVGLGEAVEDPLIAWSGTLLRRGLLPLSHFGSPGSPDIVPERPSNVSQSGEEISPEIRLQKKASEEKSKNQNYANSPAGVRHVNLAAERDVTAPTSAASSSANSANPASRSWGDTEMAEVESNDGYTLVGNKKRRLGSPPSEHTLRQPNKPGEQRGSQQHKRPTGPRKVPPQEIKATRKNIAEAKARQNSSTHENYIFVERCPEIPDYT